LKSKFLFLGGLAGLVALLALYAGQVERRARASQAAPRSIEPAHEDAEGGPSLAARLAGDLTELSRLLREVEREPTVGRETVWSSAARTNRGRLLQDGLALGARARSVAREAEGVSATRTVLETLGALYDRLLQTAPVDPTPSARAMRAVLERFREAADELTEGRRTASLDGEGGSESTSPTGRRGVVTR